MLRILVPCVCLTLLSVLPLSAQQPAHTLDTLTVTVGSRLSAELPVAIRGVKVITAEDLARQPVRTIHDALANALGVDLGARSPAQADLSIRGGTFEQVLVMVDGMRVKDAQTGHFNLDLAVPLQEVQRIEILRGPASAQYGTEALGGVVNIVTRRPAASGLDARIAGGSFGSTSAAAGARVVSDGMRFGGSGEYSRSDGHRVGTDHRMASGRLELEAPIAGRSLRAALGVADREFGAANFYTSPTAAFDEFEATRVTTLQVALAAPRDTRFSVEPRASLRRHDDDFVLRRTDPSFYRNIHQTSQIGVELVTRYAGEHVQVALGAETYWDEIESSNLGDRRESREAIFGEIGAGRVGRLLGSVGMRADRHSAFGTHVSPSIGAGFWFTPELHARTSFNRSFRAPTWTERYYTDPANVGNPTLEPEEAREGELGIELRTKGVQASISGYVRHARSLIDWARPTGGDPTVPWRTMNVEEARFRGVELELLGVEFLGGRWQGRASAIAFDASAAQGYESKYALRPLTHQAALELDRPVIAGVGLFARGAYARRAGEDGYLRMDMRLNRRFGDARLFVDLTNVMGTEYLDIAGMPAAGRAFHLGLDWVWRR